MRHLRDLSILKNQLHGIIYYYKNDQTVELEIF